MKSRMSCESCLVRDNEDANSDSGHACTPTDSQQTCATSAARCILEKTHGVKLDPSQISSRRDDFISTNNDNNPVASLVSMWVLKIMVPTSMLVWIFTRHLTLSLFASLALPLLAIAQGAIQIIKYRLYFGDAPVPILPCHGVVRVVSSDEDDGKSTCLDPEPLTNRILEDEVDSRHRSHFETILDGTRLPLLAASFKSEITTSDCGTIPPIYQTNRRRKQEGRRFNANQVVSKMQQQIKYQKRQLHTRNHKSHQDAFDDEPDHAVEDHDGNDSRRPIRLLLIGDSLAIGVGQSIHCTPVLPEVVAKTLSRRLDGRTVYWTCHGASGASTGWIVRELERTTGLQKLSSTEHSQHINDADNKTQCAKTATSLRGTLDKQPTYQKQFRDESFLYEDKDDVSCYSTATDDDSWSTCSSDENQNHLRVNSSKMSNGVISDSHSTLHFQSPQSGQSKSIWQDRLIQHRNRFENQSDNNGVLGPYDIVVVVAGSNDLKSAFFPFLLRGEDAEFRRQAAERGGSYYLELRRLVQTLHSRMIGTTTGHVGNVDVHMNTSDIDRDNVTHMNKMCTHTSNVHRNPDKYCYDKHTPILPSSSLSSSDSSLSDKQHQFTPMSSVNINKSNSVSTFTSASSTKNNCISMMHKSPLIVLPGLPAKSLPIFQSVPLRWAAVPVVEIMDLNKRKLAISSQHQCQETNNEHNNHNVLFVPAPTLFDLKCYENKRGPYWNQQCSDKVLLELHDIHDHDAKRLEYELQQYYALKTKRYFSLRQLFDFTCTIFSFGLLKDNYSKTNSSAESLVDDECTVMASSTKQTEKISSDGGSGLYSIDSVHPNDRGYGFWGRYIGNAIADKLLLESQQNPNKTIACNGKQMIDLSIKP